MTSLASITNPIELKEYLEKGNNYTIDELTDVVLTNDSIFKGHRQLAYELMLKEDETTKVKVGDTRPKRDEEWFAYALKCGANEFALGHLRYLFEDIMQGDYDDARDLGMFKRLVVLRTITQDLIDDCFEGMDEDSLVYVELDQLLNPPLTESDKGDSESDSDSDEEEEEEEETSESEEEDDEEEEEVVQPAKRRRA